MISPLYKPNISYVSCKNLVEHGDNLISWFSSFSFKENSCWSIHEIVSFQEKDLEVCQASLAVAHAAAELTTSDPSELPSVPAILTSQQLDELAQLRRTVTTLHEELDVLRSMNTELQNEIESVVSKESGLVLHVDTILEGSGSEARQTWKGQTKMPMFMLSAPRPYTIFCFALIHYEWIT